MFDVLRGKKQDSEKVFFKALAKNFFVNMEKLSMAELLPNGLHEKVMICSICYITKSRLDVHFVLWLVIGQIEKADINLVELKFAKRSR